MRNKVEDCINTYFHLYKNISPAQEEGIIIHSNITSHVQIFKKFPDYLPQFQLTNPEVEKEVVASYNELFDLKGRIDVLDSPCLYEIKSGISDSLEYSNTYQLPFYFLLCSLTNIPIDKGYIIHFNQRNRIKDWVLFWNDNFHIQRAKNLIESIGIEIWDFFEKEGLL